MTRGTYLILALLGLPFFVSLDVSSVWDANEAFYVQTPREMVERNDWLLPYFNGEPRLNKPPLAYWLVAPLYKLFSVSLFWERLWMALLGYGSVLAAFAIGRSLFPDPIPLWGAAVFATTFRLQIVARRLLIDVLLLFCLLAALAFFLSWLNHGRRRDFLLSCLFFGLAFLAKGPVALLPVLFLVPFVILTRGGARWREAPWLPGGLIFLGVSASWFLVLGWVEGWQVVADLFWKENVGRFAGLEFGPHRGPFYYLGVFAADFFPWSLLFPAALVWWWRGHRFRAAASEGRDAVVLLSLWILVYFVFFSLSQNKQEYYILPLYPAAALGIAYWADRAGFPRWLGILAGILLAALGLAIFAGARVLFPGESYLWLPLPALAVAVASLAARRLPAAAVGLALFFFLAFACYLAPLERYKPVPHLADRLRIETELLPPSTPFQAGYYRVALPSLAFYLNRPILELFEIEEAVRHLDGQEPVFLIVPAEDYELLQEATVEPLEIVEVRPRLYTTARTLIQGLKSGRLDRIAEGISRPLYLIRNRKEAQHPPWGLRGGPRLQREGEPGTPLPPA